MYSSPQDVVLQAPVVLSRDHHDVSGTDSPFRETSNVYDGSAFTAGKYTSHDLLRCPVRLDLPPDWNEARQRDHYMYQAYLQYLHPGC